MSNEYKVPMRHGSRREDGAISFQPLPLDLLSQHIQSRNSNAIDICLVSRYGRQRFPLSNPCHSILQYLFTSTISKLLPRRLWSLASISRPLPPNHVQRLISARIPGVPHF